MITTVLKKSTSINYFLAGILMFVLFFIYQTTIKTDVSYAFQWFQKLGLLLVVFASIFLTDFIAKKNDLSKDSSFTVFFCLFFFLFFPEVLNNNRLLISNLFVLLAMRRLISMSSNLDIKVKIFDASLWIFVATIFHFWSILFLFLIIISVFLDASRDYRNWLIPIIGFLCVGIIFLFYAFLFDITLIDSFLNRIFSSYKIDYFTNIYQNLALSIFVMTAFFFFAAYILSLAKMPMILYSSFKKLLAWFAISVLIFLISNYKNNSVLIFSFAPLAMMATNYIETTKIVWQRDVVFYGVIIFSFFCFISQL